MMLLSSSARPSRAARQRGHRARWSPMASRAAGGNSPLLKATRSARAGQGPARERLSRVSTVGPLPGSRCPRRAEIDQGGKLLAQPAQDARPGEVDGADAEVEVGGHGGGRFAEDEDAPERLPGGGVELVADQFDGPAAQRPGLVFL